MLKMNNFLSYFNNYRMYINRLLREIISKNGKETPELCYAVNIYDRNTSLSAKSENSQSILERIIDNGFLWAAPKHRRSLERRMKRRMGYGKLILPKNNIVVCNSCGHFHPIHTVCGNCYEKVKAETELMKEAILKELKLDPIEKEIVVMYENDPKDQRIFEGKRIVEIPKERPQWFCQNLLVKDSQIPREKPKALGMPNVQPTVTNDDK